MDYESYIGRGVHRVTGRDREPTFLPNRSEWVSNVLCIEGGDNVYTADVLIGGVDGISNAQAQALANRTNYLQERLVKLFDYVQALILTVSPMLENIKGAVFQKTAPSDSANYIWFLTTQNFTAPTVTLTFADATHIDNPVLRLEYETGNVVYLRTDGLSGNIGDIDINSFND